jgi:lysophospholipase L1-like esterase
MANVFRIVTFGDSVPWGQGLIEAEKYDVQVKEALTAKFPGGVSLERFAHSGAVIGATPVTGKTANGEVPLSRPTIIEQCDGFANSTETVDLVLLDGGINDVGVATILNPLALVPSLQSRIASACHNGMLTLLRKISAKFTKPSCRILVTGYYYILSDKSDPLHVPRLLSLHGIATPGFLEEANRFDPIFDRCERFFDNSNAQLRSAVADANDPRIAFVPSGFTEDNAVFVPGTALLWGLDDKLNPQDHVVDERRAQCKLTFGSPTEILHREQCFRASAGHPNPAGAVQFKSQLLAALG